MLKAITVTSCLFQAVKYAENRSQKLVHDSMLPSYKPLNRSLADLTKVNAKNALGGFVSGEVV